MRQEETIIKTGNCYSCGKPMEGRIENYKYDECGLKSVTLKNILVFHCKPCGAIVPEISNAQELHRLIGLKLLLKDSLLTGAEVKFLRKLLGYSATDFAEVVGTSKTVISRWENRSTFGKDSDRMIRLICINKFVEEGLSEVQKMPEGEEKEQLTAVVANMLELTNNALKGISKSRRGHTERYLIETQSSAEIFMTSKPTSPPAPILQ